MSEVGPGPSPDEDARHSDADRRMAELLRGGSGLLELIEDLAVRNEDGSVISWAVCRQSRTKAAASPPLLPEHATPGPERAVSREGFGGGTWRPAPAET